MHEVRVVRTLLALLTRKPEVDFAVTIVGLELVHEDDASLHARPGVGAPLFNREKTGNTILKCDEPDLNVERTGQRKRTLAESM